MIGTGNPVRVSLDGEQVFDDPNPADPTTAPAYHRGRGVTVELSQGKHNLEIELVHSGQDALDTQSLVLFFTLVATRARVEAAGAVFQLRRRDHRVTARQKGCASRNAPTKEYKDAD